MITVKQFKDLLSFYQNQTAVFSNALDTQTLESMQQESENTFSFFAGLPRHDRFYNEKIPNTWDFYIRQYFKIRWMALKKSSLAYTRHPFLPVNQFCLKVAEGIARPKEAVCQILMPDLVGLNRESGELKFETEVDGHFKPKNYIINQNYTHLIPVKEVFKMAAVDSNHVLADFQPPWIRLSYRLGGRDFLNLEKVAGEAGKSFIRVLKQHHEQRYDNHSLGFAIRELATEMKKGSVEDSGSEYFADNEVIADAIKSFYTLWRSLPQDLSLPQEKEGSSETKKLLKDLRLESYESGNVTLESYFLTVFVRQSDCPLTKEELKRQQKEDIFPCAHQISNCLFEFLNNYPLLYKLSIDANPTENDLPSLKSLLPSVLKALNNRSQMLDGNDDRFFEQLIESLLQSVGKNVAAAAGYIAPWIKTYQDFQHLTVSRALFKAVAERVQSDLTAMPFMTGLHKLLLFFPDKQQQLIIDANFEELIQEHNTLTTYQELIINLSESAQTWFREKYAKQLAASIHSSEDFLSLQKKVDIALIDKVFDKLKAKYTALFASYQSTCNILSVISSRNKEKRILTLIKPHLYKWVNAENYSFFYSLFDGYYGLPSTLAKQIRTHSTSFELWRKNYLAWRNHYWIQSLLLKQLLSDYRHEIKNSGTLLSLVQKTHFNQRLELVKAYQPLINTKELFDTCLDLIQRTERKNFLLSVTSGVSIPSISDLKSYIRAQRCRNSRQRSIFSDLTDETVCLAYDLINKLENEHLSSLEKITVLDDAVTIIKRKYACLNGSHDLYNIICNCLDEIDASAKESLNAYQKYDVYPQIPLVYNTHTRF